MPDQNQGLVGGYIAMARANPVLQTISGWLRTPQTAYQPQPTIPPTLANLLKSPLFNASQQPTRPQQPPAAWNYNNPVSSLLNRIIKIPPRGPTF